MRPTIWVAEDLGYDGWFISDLAGNSFSEKDNGKKLVEYAEYEKLQALLQLSIQLMSRPQKGMLDSLFAKAAELGIQLERVRE